MQPTLGVVGFGYTAAFLADKLAQHDFNIIGTSRNEQTRQHYQNKGYQLVAFNPAAMASLLNQTTHLCISVPPTEMIGDPVLAEFLPLLERYCGQWQWLGYLSSTGVYGDHQGAWVDETTAPQPLSQRAKLRLDAEIAWQQFSKQQQLPLHIFRLAGIYGPDRNALHDIIHGKSYSVYKAGQFFSRIHVADIAKIIFASIQNPHPGIYNLADDLPAPSHEVDHYVAALLQKEPLPVLPFERAPLSAMAKEFYSHNRRVSNAKVKATFQLELDYPSYKQGLIQLLSSSLFDR